VRGKRLPQLNHPLKEKESKALVSSMNIIDTQIFHKHGWNEKKCYSPLPLGEAGVRKRMRLPSPNLPLQGEEKIFFSKKISELKFNSLLSHWER